MLLAFNRGYSTVPSASSYILRDIHARMNFSKRGHVLCISCTITHIGTAFLSLNT